MNYICPISIPVLLVDDEEQTLISYSTVLKSAGIEEIFTLNDSREVMPFLSKNRISMVLLDLSMPFKSGREILDEINENFPELSVIVITALDDLNTAVACMQKGAKDYLVKPVDKNRLISSIKRVIEIGTLEKEIRSLRHYLLTDELKNPDLFSHIITKSPKMLSIFKYVEAIADSPFPVMLTGETGVGKELVAKSIHLSTSKSKNFIAINVAGLDDTMFSDTLFGHKKGAFTGADSPRDGLISKAEHGTIFLDEIGDLNTPSQVKLLRLIQEKEYYQLGADLPKKVNTRIIVATNKDIKTLVSEGKFRKDLYFRLSAHHINIPPLRERTEDIPLLTKYFIEEASNSMDKKVPTYPSELLTLLSTYAFPGNIRELQALIYDAVSRHKSGILSLEVFRNAFNINRDDFKVKTSKDFFYTKGFSEMDTNFPTLKQAEEYLIEQALTKADGNQGIAASLLGLSRQALNKRLLRKKRKN